MQDWRSDGKGSPLFRDEALERFRGSPLQPVLLSTPISTNLLLAFSFAAAVALVGFATTFEFARKEQVQGFLVPTAGWSRVTAKSFGVVSQLHANPGDEIRSGDVLMEISFGDGLQQALTVQDRMLEEIKERRATLDATASLIDRQYQHQRALLTNQNESDRRELEHLNEEIQLAEARLKIAQQRHRNSKQLAALGALSQTDVDRLEEEVQSRLLSLSERMRVADRLRSMLVDNETRLTQLAVKQELDQASIREQFHAITMEESRIRSEKANWVLAPRDGVVASVRVEVGDSVQPGKALLDVIPPGSDFQGRLFAPSTAMGFVEPGQEVRVHLDAFPYERYGVQSGTVLSVSKTTLAWDEAEFAHMQSGPIYSIDVEFDDGFNLPPSTPST